jgi:hypothetical protein
MPDTITSRWVRRAVRVSGWAALGFVAAVGVTHAQEAKSPTHVRRPIASSPEIREYVIQRVLAHPDVAAQAPGHRLAGIRAAAAVAAEGTAMARTVFTVVLFDHTALEARRVEIDVDANRILRNERLPGRPQRAGHEVDAAISIVRRDRALARLLDRGAVLDGGFIVDDPGGSRRRMLQLKMMTADRRSLIQTITVDLTRGEIAAAAVPPGERR